MGRSGLRRADEAVIGWELRRIGVVEAGSSRVVEMVAEVKTERGAQEMCSAGEKTGGCKACSEAAGKR